MKISISFLFLILLAALPLTVAAAEPVVIYWNSEAGKALRARIAPDEDYWQLIPWFTEQVNQTYCGVIANNWGQTRINLLFLQPSSSFRVARVRP